MRAGGARLSVVVLLLLAAGPAWPAPDPPSAIGPSEIRFAETLGLGDIELRGARALARVDFFGEPGSKPAAGSRLWLVIEHSPSLDERSFLSIWLNHGILRSLRLDASNATVQKLEVEIPAGMLQASNQLVFSVEQSSAQEDGAWTRVLASSSVSLAFEPAPVAWTLGDLPAPLLHRRTQGPRRLTILLPSGPSPATVEATALAVANLCRQVAPEPVSIAFVRQLAQAASPVLAVGTPREQPELQGLALPEPLHLGPAGLQATVDGKRVDLSDGVVALVTASARAVLVLTGNTPEAVARAGRGLRVSATKGEVVRLVGEMPADPPRGPRHWRGYAPPWNPFTIGDVGDDETELAVTAQTPARVRVRATPDAVYLPYGHALKLELHALPALAEDPDGVLEVRWNERLVRRERLRSLGRGPDFSLALRLPSEALRLDNELRIGWNGRSGASGPFLTLQPESELYLPRDFVARTPDLALLRSSFYPLSLQADLADTMVVTPEGAGDDGLAALCELAALLGRMLPADRLAFEVAGPSEPRARAPQANLILLETAKSAFRPDLPLTETRPLKRGEALKRLPVLEARISPWNADKHVLRFRAASPTLLRAAIRSLSRPGALEQLRGDTAFLAAEGPVCFALAPQRTVAEVSHLTRLEAWLRDNWLALPAILALFSGLLYMGLRLTLEQKRAARAATRAA